MVEPLGWVNTVPYYSVAYRKGRHISYWFECPYCGAGFASRKDSIRATKYLKSCGCKAKEFNGKAKKGTAQDAKKAVINLMLSRCRTWARRNPGVCSLSFQDVKALIFSKCFYCNSLPKRVRTVGSHSYKRNGAPSNGIDRYDSAIGYTPNNCVPCCWACNRMKSNLHGKEFIKICNIISENCK